MKKLMIIPSLLLAFTFLEVSSVQAEPSGQVKSLAKRYRNLDRKMERLATRFERLSTAQKSNLLQRLTDKYEDVDGDNLPDFLESESGRCDMDLDDDGILDGDDLDDDSNSPPQMGNEIEIHSTIQSISASSITVNGTTFILNESTEYLDDDNNPITREDFSVGECVEVEGFSSGENLIAEKVKEDDDC